MLCVWRAPGTSIETGPLVQPAKPGIDRNGILGSATAGQAEHESARVVGIPAKQGEGIVVEDEFPAALVRFRGGRVFEVVRCGRSYRTCGGEIQVLPVCRLWEIRHSLRRGSQIEDQKDLEKA